MVNLLYFLLFTISFSHRNNKLAPSPISLPILRPHVILRQPRPPPAVPDLRRRAVTVARRMQEVSERDRRHPRQIDRLAQERLPQRPLRPARRRRVRKPRRDPPQLRLVCLREPRPAPSSSAPASAASAIPAASAPTISQIGRSMRPACGTSATNARISGCSVSSGPSMLASVPAPIGSIGATPRTPAAARSPAAAWPTRTTPHRAPPDQTRRAGTAASPAPFAPSPLSRGGPG